MPTGDTAPSSMFPPASAGGVAAASKASSSTACQQLSNEEKFLLNLAILTLYKDQIRPYQLEVKHRLQELNCSSTLESNFVAFYSAMPDQYVVERNLKAKTVMYFKQTPRWFKGWVDPKDPHNPYPMHVWRAVNEYLQQLIRCTPKQQQQQQQQQATQVTAGTQDSLSINPPPTPPLPIASPDAQSAQPPMSASSRGGGGGGGSGAVGGTNNNGSTAGSVCGGHDDASVGSGCAEQYEFRGGRYGMAKKLKADGPVCLRYYTLGQLSHIVQLAISQGLVAYENDVLQPVATCKGLVSAIFLNESQDNRPAVTSVDEVKQKMRKLLAENNREVLLSQLKYKFSHMYGQVLNPVMFGYTKLSDMLVEKCQDVCRLYRHGGRHVIVHDTSYSPPENEQCVELVPSRVLRASNPALFPGSSAAPNEGGNTDGGSGSRTGTPLSAFSNGHSNVSFHYWQFLDKTKHTNVTGKDSKVTSPVSRPESDGAPATSSSQPPAHSHESSPAQQTQTQTQHRGGPTPPPPPPPPPPSSNPQADPPHPRQKSPSAVSVREAAFSTLGEASHRPCVTARESGL
uniref:HTH OST-type domain-containing protein n=1 Tax=Vitrella brassicaformis TaxID=1169539 RepID=A0A7S1KEK2_9ALVE